MNYPFSSYLYKCENEVVQELLNYLEWSAEDAQTVHKNAVNLVEKTRAQKSKGGQLEKFLQEFSLNTEEGLAMMCLAEALLRIPDAKTANALIKDKVVAANWLQKQGDGSKDWIAKAAGIGMSITRKTLDSTLSRLGAPVIRASMIRAMQMMGKQFVLGTSIEDAISNSRLYEKQGYRLSYDILGEGARDRITAEHYFSSYADAIDKISAKNGQSTSKNSGISVKLSALHPRYSYSQKDKCIPEIIDNLKYLCLKAAAANMPLTIDAEEVNRLNISIDIFTEVLSTKELEGWDGFGLAVQTYQKRSLLLIKYLSDIAREKGRKIQVRLVKGAYWDSEIKHAQMGGFDEYPVFTRKNNTDLSYLACAQELFSNKDMIYPMFATHNAHTIAAIMHMANKYDADYEFQRLHGMGAGVYAAIMEVSAVKVSVYAPVGPHEDLLPYLVRRLLENGANSSFINQLLDNNLGAASIVGDPVDAVRINKDHSHPDISLPKDIFGLSRVNSRGLDLDDYEESRELLYYIKNYNLPSEELPVNNSNDIDEVFIKAKIGFASWNKKDVHERKSIILCFSDILEQNSHELVAILVKEGGKTIPDSYNELREAIDFCRYYAVNACEIFDKDGIILDGYTGETNRLIMQGRGIFVCISPWNFPLAIFIGQIIAALSSGNAVIAKPASQTRYIAVRTIELMYKAGIPADILHLLLGNGAFGGEIVAHKQVAGVAFTGSTATAKRIQLTLAENNDKIVPFIAETGGQNAMIVDSSALPEQVVDDVIISAFGSAGQRCSALRVLYVQNEIADDVINILKGAMAELVIANPSDISTDIGYIIDDNAKQILDNHIDYISKHGKFIAKSNVAEGACLFAPIAYEIAHINVLKEEVFGPILHIIRYDIDKIDDVISQINDTGYGLTFGSHSRIQMHNDRLSASIHAGNIYINRSMTGAVVGVQPFGGMGLSGSGPKAGGPNYLHAFAVEKVITTDTTALGGNTHLISL